MRLTPTEIREREGRVEEIAAQFPPGSLVVIANATGKAETTVYRVIKHWPPGGKVQRHKVDAWRAVSSKNYVWLTSLEPILNLDITSNPRKRAGGAQYPTVYLQAPDIIAMCAARSALDKVIQEYVKSLGPDAPEQRLEEE